jgi:hypothetical protein
MEIGFAIFANVLERDDQGQPINEKHADANSRLESWTSSPWCVPSADPALPGTASALEHDGRSPDRSTPRTTGWCWPAGPDAAEGSLADLPGHPFDVCCAGTVTW